MKGSERFRHYDTPVFTYIHLRLYVYTSPTLRIYISDFTYICPVPHVLSYKPLRPFMEDVTSYRGGPYDLSRKTSRLPAKVLTSSGIPPYVFRRSPLRLRTETLACYRQYPSSFQEHFRLSLQKVDAKTLRTLRNTPILMVCLPSGDDILKSYIRSVRSVFTSTFCKMPSKKHYTLHNFSHSLPINRQKVSL